MKTGNVIIAALLAALVVASYMLVVKIFTPSSPPAPQPAQVAPVKPAAPEQGIIAQPGQNVEKPAPPAPAPRTSITIIEQPAEHTSQNPAAPVKEEPGLRPARDIKVVMYMTDW